MAHRVETMMYAGEAPWHGLGTKVEGDALRSWRRTMELAGLDWHVSQAPLYLADGREVTHVANVRDTDGSVLGVVGPRFTVLQNEDAFAFFEPWLAAGECQFEAAGSLAEGSRIWALASIRGTGGEVAKGDEVRRYVLLSHSHDGSLAVRVGFTDVRVVCNNTLTAAHKSDGSSLIRLKHTSGLKDSLAAVRETMDLAREGFYATLEQFRTLRRKDVNQDDVRRYVQMVLDVKAGADGELATKTQNTVNRIIELAYTGLGNNGSSLWDAFNGVTEYTTWEKGRSPESRLASQWYGDSRELNARALAVALEMAEV